MDASLYGEIHAIERDHWWYVGRRRIVFDWLRRIAPPETQPRILDIGCGTGFNIEQLHGMGYRRVAGLDLSSEAIGFCRSRGLKRLVQGDATMAPFTDGSFDVILALDLIEHVADDVTAIRGLSSMLVPGGSLVIFTPAYQFLWSRQDEISHHFRRYTSRELRQKLTRAGLAIGKLSYANTILFPLVWAGRVAMRFRRSDARENDAHPAWANGALTALFSVEREWLRYAAFPFGVSLLAVASRPGEETRA